MLIASVPDSPPNVASDELLHAVADSVAARDSDFEPHFPSSLFSDDRAHMPVFPTRLGSQSAAAMAAAIESLNAATVPHRAAERTLYGSKESGHFVREEKIAGA